MHRLADAVIIHQRYTAHAVAVGLQHRQRQRPDAQRDQPVGDARRALQRHGVPRGERALQLGIAGGLPGIVTTARTPISWAAYATAWPWLPELNVITPRRRAASGRFLIAL